jgi:hypothetical protein
MPRGAIAIHDWPTLFSDFLTKQRSDSNYELKDYCKETGLNYQFTSKNFALRARLIAGDTLAMLAPRAAKKLGECLDNEDANLSVKSSVAILDRAGFSPQAVSLTVNQTNVTAIQLPPLFREDYTSKYKDFEAEVIDAE